MGRTKVPIELMAELCRRALDRSRRRHYMMCWEKVVKLSPDQAKEVCSEYARKIPFFHKEDFEVEARKYIQEKRAWRLRLPTLLRKLRALASDEDEDWITWYKGDYGRQRGLYQLKYARRGKE